MIKEKPQFDIKEQAVITEAVRLSEENTDKVAHNHSRNFQWWIAAVVLVCVLGFLQLLFAYFQFSSATYKEYVGRTETQNILLETNKKLLEKNNLQQKEIINLLDKLSKYKKIDK